MVLLKKVSTLSVITILFNKLSLMVTKLVTVSSIRQYSFQMECVVNCTDQSLSGDDDDDDDDDTYTDTCTHNDND